MFHGKWFMQDGYFRDLRYKNFKVISDYNLSQIKFQFYLFIVCLSATLSIFLCVYILLFFLHSLNVFFFDANKFSVNSSRFSYPSSRHITCLAPPSVIKVKQRIYLLHQNFTNYCPNISPNQSSHNQGDDSKQQTQLVVENAGIRF